MVSGVLFRACQRCLRCAASGQFPSLPPARFEQLPRSSSRPGPMTIERFAALSAQAAAPAPEHEKKNAAMLRTPVGRAYPVHDTMRKPGLQTAQAALVQARGPKYCVPASAAEAPPLTSSE